MKKSKKNPPPGFKSSPLQFCKLHPERVWKRLYWSKYSDPLGFGHDPSRFSDPRRELPEAERFGVLYFGASLEVCFLEAVLRDKRNGHIGNLLIGYSELSDRVCAEIKLREPLLLVDLRGEGPIRMGVPTDAVRASRHKLGQRWSLAFWSHDDRPDGLIYPSRLNEEENVALYDRAIKKVQVSDVKPLLDYRKDVARMIRKFRLSVKREMRPLKPKW